MSYIIRVKNTPGESLSGRFIYGPSTPAQVKREGYHFGTEREKAWPFPSRKQAAQKARIVERHMSQPPGWMEVIPPERETDDSPLSPDGGARFDYEVELTTKKDGTKRTIFGYAASPAAARARAVSIYKDDLQGFRVIRTVLEHAPRSTPLAQLAGTWEPDPETNLRSFHLTDAKGRRAAAEVDGGHLHRAYEFLAQAKPAAAWKTLDLLMTLRQAFREDTVNGHDADLDELRAGAPSKARVMAYLAGARVRDEAHHGTRTF